MIVTQIHSYKINMANKRLRLKVHLTSTAASRARVRQVKYTRIRWNRVFLVLFIFYSFVVSPADMDILCWVLACGVVLWFLPNLVIEWVGCFALAMSCPTSPRHREQEEYSTHTVQYNVPLAREIKHTNSAVQGTASKWNKLHNRPAQGTASKRNKLHNRPAQGTASKRNKAHKQSVCVLYSSCSRSHGLVCGL